MAVVTVSAIVVLAVSDPEVPVIVTVDVPVVAELLAVRVSTLLPVVGFVPNEAVTPLGSPDAASVTLPVKPPTSVTVMVSVALLPCATESAVGEAASVKLGLVLVLTVNAMDVVAVNVPDVPVIVTVDEPVVAVLLAVNVKTLVLVVGFVPNDAVTPLGSPEAARVTLPVKPPTSVTVIVSVALLPCVIESELGEAASVKLGVVFALTLNAILVVAVCDPDVPVTVTVNAPVVAVLLAVRVSTLLLVVGFVPNEAVTPLGSPDAARVTLPVKPPTSVTVIVSVALLPCVIESEVGDAASVKLEAAGMVTAIGTECVTEPSVPTMLTFVVPGAVPVCAKKLTDAVPLEFTEDGLKLACTPDGRLVALSATLPVSPPT